MKITKISLANFRSFKETQSIERMRPMNPRAILLVFEVPR